MWHVSSLGSYVQRLWLEGAASRVFFHPGGGRGQLYHTVLVHPHRRLGAVTKLKLGQNAFDMRLHDPPADHERPHQRAKRYLSPFQAAVPAPPSVAPVLPIVRPSLADVEMEEVLQQSPQAAHPTTRSALYVASPLYGFPMRSVTAPVPPKPQLTLQPDPTPPPPPRRGRSRHLVPPILGAEET